MESSKWYVLISHPRREEMLHQHVLSLGFESYYPSIRVNPVNPRAHKTQPYFPGYIFIRADLASVGDSVFQWMPYSNGLISFGGEPAVLPDPIVDSIIHYLEYLNQTRAENNRFTAGQKVYIETGVFAGYEASFINCHSGSQRVRVLLKILSQGKTVMVDLPANHIRSSN